MIVDIHGQGSTLAPALAEHVRHSLHDVSIHRGAVIQRVVVRVGGTNGRRGHHDMYCLMQVRMSDALVATVVDIGPHINDVIDRATDRVCRLVAAYLDQAARDRRSPASSAYRTLRQQGPRSGAARQPAVFGPVWPVEIVAPDQASRADRKLKPGPCPGHAPSTRSLT